MYGWIENLISAGIPSIDGATSGEAFLLILSGLVIVMTYTLCVDIIINGFLKIFKR